jgi:hypothetical protein
MVKATATLLLDAPAAEDRYDAVRDPSNNVFGPGVRLTGRTGYAVRVTFDDGTVEDVPLGVFRNDATGRVYGYVSEAASVKIAVRRNPCRNREIPYLLSLYVDGYIRWNWVLSKDGSAPLR